MTKLKRLLWAIVFIYLMYAIAVSGPSVETIGLLIGAIVVCLAQECIHSQAYAKWKKNKIQNHGR